jgi:paraquat-inducible protein B
MPKEGKDATLMHPVPEAVLQTKKHISIVWLIPVVAALIGGWLAAKAISEKGPTISIQFQNAEGLVAGKTKVMYKNVELGKVDSIRLSKDLGHVEVTATLSKQSESFLSDSTRFWIVRARVAAGEVSGLGTLFSGAYIGVDPGKGETARTRAFKGLDTPPIVTTDLPGRHFTLKADMLGSLDVGAPVYYRQIKVGQVDAYSLAEDGKSISVQVFIQAPHHERVLKNTRFWNAGGVDLTLTAEGIKLNTESLVSVMFGGVAFETPADLNPPAPPEAGYIFSLHPNREDAFEVTSGRKVKYLLHFDETVRGLSAGSPVEFRGIRVGQVIDIQLNFDMEKLSFLIPVLIELELDKILAMGPSAPGKSNTLDGLVAKGLRGQLRMGNPLTGQLIVDLDIHPYAKSAKVIYGGPYPEIPTVKAPLSQITSNLGQIIDKLQKLPIEEIGEDLRDTVSGAKQLVNSAELRDSLRALNDTLNETQKLTQQLNRTASDDFAATLAQAQQTLKAAETLFKSDSPLQYETKTMLQELSKAARSIRDMADYLEQHPDALIFGKESKK